MNFGIELMKLQEKIHSTEGWRISQKIRIFSLSEYTFRKNTEELVSLLSEYENNTDLALSIADVDNRNGFEAFLTEITRLLHNYLASAKTLVDHTRKFFQDEYQGTNFENDYNNKISYLFINSTTSKFIQDLRNYTLHRTLPLTGATLNFSRDAGFSHKINLSKVSLLEWDKWTAKSLAYLNEQEDSMSLLKLVSEYTEIVTQFQIWFKEQQFNIHKESMEELNKLQTEYSAMYKDFEYKLTKRGGS